MIFDIYIDLYYFNVVTVLFICILIILPFGSPKTDDVLPRGGMAMQSLNGRLVEKFPKELIECLRPPPRTGDFRLLYRTSPLLLKNTSPSDCKSQCTRSCCNESCAMSKHTHKFIVFFFMCYNIFDLLRKKRSKYFADWLPTHFFTNLC